MTPPTGPDGWTTYDALTGPRLDDELWEPIDFGAGPMVEPDAVTTVDDGVVTVEVPRFSVADAETHAFGMFTLYPVGQGQSSVHGQGGRAAWRDFRSRIAADLAKR